MPLTSRFDELIHELDLPGAAWHLGRTNSWTEHQATEEEIEKGRQQILDLVSNKNDSVWRILDQISKELEIIEPWSVLLRRRQEATLASWGKPVTDNEWAAEYADTINKIKQRMLLEKIKRQAELILNGWFEVIQGGGWVEKDAQVRWTQSPLVISQAEKPRQAA